METKILQYLWLCSLVLASGCAASGQPAVLQPPKESRYYTSAYPTQDISEQLQSIQYSVKRISATAIFQTYYFGEQMLTEEHLKGVDLRDIATRTITQNESTAGTAFAIARNSHSVVFLTCAHTVDFPDTLISYREGEDIPDKTYVQTVTVKKDQTNLLYDLPNIGRFSIIAKNTQDDLALIEINLEAFGDIQAPPLPIKMGNPELLQLGSNILVMGYPKGYPMVTRGIVSDPNRSRDGDFLTDALFNQGISGGIILASRDNYHSFEWIGMASTASAVREQELVPNPLKSRSYEDFDLYTDSIFVQTKTRISYGITQAIPTKKIVRFLEEHERELDRLGLNTDLIISYNR